MIASLPAGLGSSPVGNTTALSTPRQLNLTQKLKIRNVSEGQSTVRDGGTLWTLMYFKTTTPPTENIEAGGRHRLHVVSGISRTLWVVRPAVEATSGMPPLRPHITSVAF